ncbi:MAG: hypothetical protein KBA90_14755 [Chitinophagaceae bacterium]|nr:hypothetical protein [Chitinophagaceae bacterium]
MARFNYNKNQLDKTGCFVRRITKANKPGSRHWHRLMSYNWYRYWQVRPYGKM